MPNGQISIMQPSIVQNGDSYYLSVTAVTAALTMTPATFAQDVKDYRGRIRVKINSVNKDIIEFTALPESNLYFSYFYGTVCATWSGADAYMKNTSQASSYDIYNTIESNKKSTGSSLLTSQYKIDTTVTASLYKTNSFTTPVFEQTQTFSVPIFKIVSLYANIPSGKPLQGVYFNK